MTPEKPIIMVIQRLTPARLPNTIIDKIVIENGLTKNNTVAFAIGTLDCAK